ncbi:uncharacterized protein LOC113312513 [Papaver somniferum]|uniref:uncharacterized protein LOC113312513 n=1 Tax=Papaver somniferum TaxID=3469 RepID=UPI000E6F86AF|nr:uncharacterized protein LOC113312513 [Papaver somniferum]
MAENQQIRKLTEYVDEEIQRRDAAQSGMGQEYVYLSTDYISLASENYNASTELYPQGFLNSLEYTHMLSYRLRLKVGIPIILLKEINRREGVVEGTRLVITQLGAEEIVAEVSISREVCLAMTFDGGRDQSLRNAGFYLSSGAYSKHPKYIGVSTKEAMYGSSKLEITIIEKEHLENHYKKSTDYKQNFENSQFIDDTINQTMSNANAVHGLGT